MKIVITGGAGFVGSSLCFWLKDKYPTYTIVAFDNLKRRGAELHLADFKRREIQFIHGDIRQAEDIQAAEPFDVLVEASAEPSVLAGIGDNPSYIIQNNLYGSINCFNACLRNKAKLVFISTSRVYPIERIEQACFVEEEQRFSLCIEQSEPGISARGISEELNLSGFRSFYGATKLSSELFIQEYAAFYGMEAAITRFGVIAGPRQMGKTDQGVATLWMANHFWKKPLTYIGYGGRGKQVRDILHIADAIRLIDLQIHDTAKFTGKIFNAGGGSPCSTSLLEMTQICSEITGHRISIASEILTRPADLRIYITDNSKITTETGWAPQKSLVDIFQDIHFWLHENERDLKWVLD